MASDIDNGSSDNCGIATYTLSQTDFNCSNAGANTVTLTVTDAAGNTDTATATVTVVDVTAPVAVAQDITVALDGTGSVSITAADIDNGSTDNCAIVTYSLSQTDFDCDDLGVQMVTLTVTDPAGNSSDATALVTVEDNEAPVAIGAPITITLDESGNASITADMLDNGSTDNCGIVSRSISISDFDCMDIGDFRVTLTVMDASGNMDSTIVIVTVENGNYTDTDGDGLADNCDEDDDNDGILDADDNCPLIANADQSDIDGDGIGDECDDDRDGDGVSNGMDNCPDTFNPDQADRDNDGLGDVCDTEEINVAQALTPNGDGINDTWMIYNIENHPNNVVRVFNRWGHEVFGVRGYQNDWDGSFKNSDQPLPDSASYYYQIDLDGNGTVDYDGWLYITRY
jgi:gliding motility-associated-like protein